MAKSQPITNHFFSQKIELVKPIIRYENCIDGLRKHFEIFEANYELLGNNSASIKLMKNGVKGFSLMIYATIIYYCQTPLQLANPTELQLVGVGVDFVFPQEERKEEGRRRINQDRSSQDMSS